MIRLLRYIKPYLLIFLGAVLLLFVQANLELALPDFMSRIVNTGIQQGGVEDAIPRALRAATMEGLLTELSGETRDTVEGSFRYISPDGGEAEGISDTYPLLKTEGIYLLSDFDALAALNADNTLARALMTAAGTGGNLDHSDPKELNQGAVQFLIGEYEALGEDHRVRQNRYILKYGTTMIAYTLLAAAATILIGFLAARTSAGVARTLRGDVFRKVQSFSGSEFDSFSTASLITRTTNDINQIQTITFLMMRLVIYAPIMGIGGVLRAVDKAPSMGWLIGLAVLVLLGFITLAIALAMPKYKMIQNLLDRLNLRARENLTGLMVVRAFNKQKYEEHRFDEANRDLTVTNLFVMRVMAMMMPVIMLIMNLLTVAVIWVGAGKIASSGMQVGDMMAFLQYAMQIVTSFLMLTMVITFLPRASVSADRIAQVLDTESSILDPADPDRLPEQSPGRIEFRNVSFRYPGGEEDALRGISFTAEPGQTTAIIGSTGSGKSSIVNLIPRLYDITEGELLLDGVDIRTLRQQDLRARIGLVPQKNTLFSGTVGSNIGYGGDGADETAIRGAADTAQALAFIDEFPEGLNAPISQGGANVSGGQKQRLAIARALMGKRPVLLFDDSFSALDFRTDRALRRGLKETYGESTMIIVAQRVSTIMNAQQILVLDDGMIVGRGTHGELLRDCEAYREIAQSQLGTEELA